MKFPITYAVALSLMVAAVSAQAQFSRLKGGTIAVSATEEFTTPLTNNATPLTAPVGTPPNALSETITGQQQGTTSKPGVLAQLGFHPVAWAGIELNYQFVQFDEQYNSQYSSQPGTQQYLRVPVAFHEATAAYQFHPKHIKFQPYVNVGGGAVDFLPYLANNQWRGAGLVETGFDIPLMKSNHLAMRIQGRALIYRAPNFNNAAISTRGWVVTEEPTVGFAYHF
ncbi:hypothetical protein [Terriglobus aquaticus]|uniref:Outer membrane protein beta-barrel domain-containing protein n=1 Tax=Terriglobus aquaticus TaxID=940139 RepID=A0ABW9KPF3_9BACT|nr:hypothetical protein [Terriglobus aquaticus]